jgi:hypothetical protein
MKYGPMMEHMRHSALNTWQAGNQATACDWEYVDVPQLYRPPSCSYGSLIAGFAAGQPGTLGRRYRIAHLKVRSRSRLRALLALLVGMQNLTR